MTEADWAVITVSFNSAAALEQCWESWRVSHGNWIVVDNNSHDGSPEIAQRLGARVVRLRENVGFARACNIGARECGQELLLFANPDLKVVPEDLARLKQHLLLEGGMVTPRLINPDGTLQPNTRGMPYLVDKLASRGLALPGSDLRSYLWPTGDQISWVMGAAVATTRQAFDRVGGWPEQYFVYFEDHEIGLSYRRAGMVVRCLEDVTWTHGWARETIRGGLFSRMRATRLEIDGALRFYKRHLNLLRPPTRRQRAARS
jgi:GT2 family glycosyltransferase